MQNNQFLNFLELLASAVHSDYKPKLTKPDWNTIMKSAEKQNVFPLIVESAIKIPSFKQDKKYLEYMNASIENVTLQTINTYEFLDVYQHIAQNGIHPIVVKGILCRELYEDYKSHRPSGDEDIIIDRRCYTRVKGLLEQRGYRVLVDPDELSSDVDGIKLDYIQEVTFYHPEKALKIEVHINIFGTENEIFRRMNSLFAISDNNTVEMMVDDVAIKTFSPTDNLLFLILHSFKHFLFSGFGIRMICDVLLFQKKYEDEIDFDYLLKKLDVVNACKFYSDLIHIGNRFLGFKLRPFEEPVQIEALLDDIRLSGVFGNDNKAQTVSAVFIRSVLDSFGEKKQTKAKRIWKVLFPGKEWLYRYNPKAKTNPLYIFSAYTSRVKKGISFVLHNRNTRKESIKISEERLKLLKNYGIISG